MLKTTAEVSIVADPELKFSKGGKAWASIRCVSKTRKKDAQGKWVDGDPTWLNVIVFGRQAEMLVESNAGKGTRLLVAGRLENRPWTDREGNERQSLELTADSVALDLMFTAYSRVDKEQAEWQAASRRDAEPAQSDDDYWTDTAPF